MTILEAVHRARSSIAPARRAFVLFDERAKLLACAAMKIEPKAAHSGVVSGALFSGYASTSSAASSELLTVCAAAGVAPGGREVVALVPNKVPRFAATVEVRDALVLPKPRCISFGAAAQLPLIALTASAALSTIGLPPRRAFVGTEKLTKPATVLVAGGSGRTPQLLVALLHARGARAVAAVPAAEREAYETLGAALTVDHGIDGLGMEQAGEVDAVIDTLGREPEPLRLREALGALYVSAAPPPLVSLVEDGLLTVARRAWARREQQQKKHLQKEAAQQEPCVFAALSHEVNEEMNEALLSPVMLPLKLPTCSRTLIE